MLLNNFCLTSCGVVLIVCDQFEMSCIVDFTNVDAYYFNIIISLGAVVNLFGECRQDVGLHDTCTNVCHYIFWLTASICKQGRAKIEFVQGCCD